MSNHLPALIFRQGITSWIPTADRSVVLDFPTFDDYIKTIPTNKRGESKMVESQWPPSPSEADELHLTRWYVEISFVCLFVSHVS